MKLFETDDVQLHYREDGDRHGAPVVFANSLGTDLRLWDPILPHLPAGLRIIRYDKRGHGLSSCPTGAYSMGALVREIEALLDHLNVKNCLFVGLSIGGMIAQGLAVKRLDLVRALVLSNTAAKIGQPTMWTDRIAAVKAGARYLFSVEDLKYIIYLKSNILSYLKNRQFEVLKKIENEFVSSFLKKNSRKKIRKLYSSKDFLCL